MNRKTVAIVLALVLCLTSSMALATGSKTTANVVAATTTDSTVTVTAPTAESKAELDAIAAFVNAGKPAVQYFEAAVQTEIAAAIPATADVAKLKVDEFFPLTAASKVAAGTKMTLSTAATYKATDAVVTMVGVKVNGKVMWKVIPCTVVNGKLVVELTEDIAAQIANGNVMLSVLSDVE